MGQLAQLILQYLIMSSDGEARRLNRIILDEERPKTYLQLVEKIGDSGKYQKCMLLIFGLNWFVTGVILLSTAFLFRPAELDCMAQGLLISPQQCNQYVCSLDESLWAIYQSQEDHFRSLATIGYLCQNALTIDIVSSCTYIGALFGYIIVSFFSDNYGRKKSILLSWSICVIGSIIVATSFSIYMTAIGFFLTGFGSDASINICLFFFGEAVGTKKRQKYSIIVQIFFALGGLIATFFFFLFQNWRVVWCMLVAGPALIQLILLYCYLQETPKFLIDKGGIEIALQALNRIGKINLDRRSTLEEQDIQNVMDYQMVQQLKNKRVTPIDLCRFSSLRITTVTCSFLAFVTYSMYYGPALIIGQVGFNIFVSSTMIHLSELVVYFPAFAYIEKTDRKKIGIILFSVASFVSFILVFLEKPSQCETCYHSIIELIVVFIFRGCVSLFFCFFQVYMCELYPARIRAIGMGIISSFGTLGTILNPIYLGLIRRNGLNVFNVFLILGIVAIGCLILLPETKGRRMAEQIQQIEELKQQRRTVVSSRSPKIKRRDHKSQISYDKLISMNSRMIQSNRAN